MLTGLKTGRRQPRMSKGKNQMVQVVASEAVFSPNERYRYNLLRAFNDRISKSVSFIGLNPSTATATTNDPTVTRCMNFARAWGFDRLFMLNLFAFRATNPKIMKQARDPIGIENDSYLFDFSQAALVVCAWGNHGNFMDRGKQVLMGLPTDGRVKCFGLTKAGFPKHPLYLPGDAKPEYSWTKSGWIKDGKGLSES